MDHCVEPVGLASNSRLSLSNEECLANAQLIAAAPEMLEALRGLQSEIRQAVKMDVKNHVSLMIYDAAATKAIAKATEANA
jgi:hypothetical protein